MATIDDSSTQGDGNVRLPVVGPENKVLVVPTELKAGALSLPEVLMQSVTTIAPAIAALFFTPFVVSLAGVTAPLAYPIGFVITLILGIVLVQFTKKNAGRRRLLHVHQPQHTPARRVAGRLDVYPVRAHGWWNRLVVHGQHPAAGDIGGHGCQLGLVPVGIYARDCDCRRLAPVPRH